MCNWDDHRREQMRVKALEVAPAHCPSTQPNPPGGMPPPASANGAAQVFAAMACYDAAGYGLIRPMGMYQRSLVAAAGWTCCALP